MSQSEPLSDIASILSTAPSPAAAVAMLRSHVRDLELELAVSEAQLTAIAESIAAAEQQAMEFIAANESGRARDAVIEMSVRFRHAKLIGADVEALRAGIAMCHEHLSLPSGRSASHSTDD